MISDSSYGGEEHKFEAPSASVSCISVIFARLTHFILKVKLVDFAPAKSDVVGKVHQKDPFWIF